MQKHRTSLMLPADLWKESRNRAIDEGRDAQDLVAEALHQYLQNNPPKSEKGGGK